MGRNHLFTEFCTIFANLVASGYDDRFYVVANRARTIMRKSGGRLSKPFKDEDIILAMRHRPVSVQGKNGSVNCDGTTTGSRPRTGAGTTVSSCG